MKTVLITGASSGFGYRTTLLLARNGYTVYAGVRDLQKKESLELKVIALEEKHAIHLIQLDVTNQSDIDPLGKIAGKVDVLINNAGFGYLGAAEEFTVEEIKEQFEVNYFGAIRLIKAVVPFMRKKKRGKIINISSINGLISFPLYGVYSSSKFALETYSEALRFELRPFNITVALIEPGSFLTQFTKNKRFPKAQSDVHSPYYPLTHRFFERYKSFDKTKNHVYLSSVLGPDRVAERILRVIETKDPALHNIIGWDAHIFFLLNKILPHWLKEYLLAKVYKW